MTGRATLSRCLSPNLRFGLPVPRLPILLRASERSRKRSKSGCRGEKGIRLEAPRGLAVGLPPAVSGRQSRPGGGQMATGKGRKWRRRGEGGTASVSQSVRTAKLAERAARRDERRAAASAVPSSLPAPDE